MSLATEFSPRGLYNTEDVLVGYGINQIQDNKMDKTRIIFHSNASFSINNALFTCPSGITYGFSETSKAYNTKATVTTQAKRKANKKKKITAQKKKTATVKGSATYFEGYYTQLSVGYNFLSESELNLLLSYLGTSTGITKTISTKYKYVNSQGKTTTKTKTWTIDNVPQEKIAITYWDIMMGNFITDSFTMADLSFDVNFVKDGEMYFTNIELQFVSLHSRRPISKTHNYMRIWVKVANENKWYQMTRYAKIQYKTSSSGSWTTAYTNTWCVRVSSTQPYKFYVWIPSLQTINLVEYPSSYSVRALDSDGKVKW